MARSKNGRKKKKYVPVQRNIHKALQSDSKRLRFLKNQFRMICASAGNGSTANAFTKTDLGIFNLMKNEPITYSFLNPKFIPDSVIKLIKSTFRDMMKRTTFSYVEGAPEISLWDHFIYGETITYIMRSDIEECRVLREKLIKDLPELYQFGKDLEALKKCYTICCTLSMLCSDPTSRFLSYELELSERVEHKYTGVETRQFFWECKFEAKKIPSKRFLTRKGYRKAWRVFSKSEDFSIQPTITLLAASLFPPNGEPIGPDAKIYDVYITQHCVNRLVERLDCLDRFLLCFNIQNIIISFLATGGEFSLEGGLMDYYISGIKAGYLVYEIIDDCIIMKTFLFITNQGTPEGNKLRRLLHLTTDDAKYWHIDQLSTFINSDIYDDPRLKDVFAECNCDRLDILRRCRIQQGEEILRYKIASKLLHFVDPKDEIYDMTALKEQMNYSNA